MVPCWMNTMNLLQQVVVGRVKNQKAISDENDVNIIVTDVQKVLYKTKSLTDKRYSKIKFPWSTKEKWRDQNQQYNTFRYQLNQIKI